MRQGYWPRVEVMEPDDIAADTPAFNYHTRAYYELYQVIDPTGTGNPLGALPTPRPASFDQYAEVCRGCSMLYGTH